MEPLVAALNDESWYVRKAAAGALGEIGDSRAVEPLVAALKDESWLVRKAAAGALEEIGWEPDQGVNGAAYWVARQEWDRCVQIGAPAVEPLIVALKDRREDVRGGAAEAVGQIGDTRAVKPLVAALKDESWLVRKAAAGALARLHQRGILDERAKNSVLALRASPLPGALHSDDPYAHSSDCKHADQPGYLETIFDV